MALWMQIIFLIFGIMLFLFLFGFLGSLMGYFSEKTVTARQERLKSDRSLGDKISYTGEILDLCQRIAHIEIVNHLKALLQLNIHYDYTKLDNDAEAISKRVFDAIDFQKIEASDLCITKEYIMLHIIEITTLELLATAKEMNEMIMR